MNQVPLLSLCLIWPLLAALGLVAIRSPIWAKRYALAATVIELGLSLWACSRFDTGLAGFQLQEQYRWIDTLNIRFHVGVDGISLLFVPLSAWLTVMTVLSSWRQALALPRLYWALLLLLHSATLGVYVALDLGLFFLFWELTLPPIFFLISLWGLGALRRQAALKYLFTMLFGGVPLLFAILMLALNHAYHVGGQIPLDLSFSLPDLLNTPVAGPQQQWIFWLLVIAFAVKAPVWPLHTWLPSVAMEAPIGLTALMVGLKLGLYGLIRVAIPLAPQAALDNRWLLGILGAITLIYAALVALRQSNLRRLLAYASISHVGLVVMALACYQIQGIQGVLLQIVHFALVASSLMLLSGMIQQRIGSTDYLHLGGLASRASRLSSLLIVFMLLAMGAPGGLGFVAELLMLTGIVERLPVLSLLALLAAILAAAYSLQGLRKVLLGPVQHAAVSSCPDLRTSEIALLLLPLLLSLSLGLNPQALLNLQRNAVQSWLYPLQSIPVHMADQGRANRYCASAGC